MVIEQPLLLLVTACNPQTQLFIDYLHQQLNCPVSVTSPSSDWKPQESRRTVLLLDADLMNEEAMQRWYDRTYDDDNLVLAASNLKDEEHALKTLSALHLKGIFYSSDSLPMICKGLEALLSGEHWMSRSLMTRMISSLQHQQLNSYRPVCGLTQRELEIIGMLGFGFGASNGEIADRLFVSEHTVKSHLYNIFRKIGVHNRVQAVIWARQNLGIPPPPNLSRQRSAEHTQ